MQKYFLSLPFILFTISLSAQLTIDQIMADPKISVGALPSNIYWSEDSKTVYFKWNPENRIADSLYAVTVAGKRPYQVAAAVRRALPAADGRYNSSRTQKVYAKNGDIYLLECATGVIRALTSTLEDESEPSFNMNGDKILFTKNSNLFSLSLTAGSIAQLTNFQSGYAKSDPRYSGQERWLKQDQLGLFDILKERGNKKSEGERNGKSDQIKRPKAFYLEDKQVENLTLSPDENLITWKLTRYPAGGDKRAVVPNYVTESGFTEDIPARSKVGGVRPVYEFWMYDLKRDTMFSISTRNLPGIYDQPDYLKDYPDRDNSITAKEPRRVDFFGPTWSGDGRYAVVTIYSQDNKDRWIVQLESDSARFKTLDRWRDEAWIGGPTYALGFLNDNKTLYYQSETDGYAHLYTVDLESMDKKQLTSGKFEVQTVQLSADNRWFYLTTNEVHPGEKQFYRMPVSGGERTRLTPGKGAYQVVVSPDESMLAYLYSNPVQPWELYLQENRPGAEPVQVTRSQSTQFKSYKWREPEIITIKARDGAEVYARLYAGKGKKGTKPAVVFVHGAGYLQNAHRWWSQYFREYMFHNFLVDNGYTVLDMDYRGSSGYGRDCRTGIYRYMGGKDLTDEVDGAKWLVENQGVDPKRIGIYGGSYGGFITLMALFTTPDVFKSGAALRPVTDWAAYNHEYTSNILNTPQADSIAYRRSSPIYHAEGLKGNLLICHGMVDVNVHFQDVVRLSQRLIELKKDNWELAPYPVEDHGFVEPSSWTDEYKRIFKLFERTLK